jgi:CRP-like cAMP-binding protein
MDVMNARHEHLAEHHTIPANNVRRKAASYDREIAGALRGASALRALAPASLSRLAAGATRIELVRGAPLFANGADCPGLYIVASGRFMLCVGDAVTGLKVIRLAEPGDPIALVATLLGILTFASAEALVDSSVVLIPRDTLLERAGRDAQLALALATMAAQQARKLAVDLESVSLQSGRERIVNYLLACATAGPAVLLTVLLPAKKSIIASRLSVTPEYFSRTLHELIEAGAIDVNGRQIIIRDAARLRGINPRAD